MTTLIIGDIHGCYTELLALLDKAGLGDTDEIIALGDIIDRGPDSPKILDFFHTRPHTRSLMGNHERKHIRSHRGELHPAESQIITRLQLQEAGQDYDSAVAFISTFPYYLQLPQALLVHGYYEPGVPLTQQRQIVLAGTMGGDHYLSERYPRPWYELYDGDRPLIIGHHNYTGSDQPFIYRDRVFGLDTDCVYGRALTGLLLPDFRFLSVPSPRHYWSLVQKEWPAHRTGQKPTPLAERSWDKLADWIAQTEHRCLTQADPATAAELAHIRQLVATAEATLSQLLAYVLQENDQLLTRLRAETRYDQMVATKQGSLYASRLPAEIRDKPAAKLFHLARKGELTPKKLRHHFWSPAEVFKLAHQLNLPLRNKQYAIRYQLRPATPTDYNFLYHLHITTIKPYVAATWGWDDTTQANFFRQKFDPTTRQIILLDGRPIGVLSLQEQPTETFLALIEILPDYQGQGIGTAVIKDVIHTAHQHNRPVTLHVLKTNHPAHRLYQHLGFTITAETPTHFHMKHET